MVRVTYLHLGERLRRCLGPHWSGFGWLRGSLGRFPEAHAWLLASAFGFSVGGSGLAVTAAAAAAGAAFLGSVVGSLGGSTFAASVFGFSGSGAIRRQVKGG